jgi:HEAT repeat protein
MPTPALLEAVARCVDEEQKDSVRLAAIVATGAGWRAFRVVRMKNSSEATCWDVPMASIAAIQGALNATSNVLRINAARLLAEFPMVEALPQLRTALLDHIWTVRWNAVRAIAALEPDESLIEVLIRSQPHERSNVVAHDFCLAVEALRASGLSLPHELLQYDEPT